MRQTQDLLTKSKGEIQKLEQGDKIIFQHGLHLGILLVLPAAVLEHQSGIFFRNVPWQGKPVVKAVVCQLDGVLLVGLSAPQAIVPLIMHQHCVDYRNIKAGVVQQPSYWKMVITRGFHNDTGLTR